MNKIRNMVTTEPNYTEVKQNFERVLIEDAGRLKILFQSNDEEASRLNFAYSFFLQEHLQIKDMSCMESFKLMLQMSKRKYKI